MEAMDSKFQRYEEFKGRMNAEAEKDRQRSLSNPENRRAEFIEKVHHMFPEVNPKAIAETIKPWDPAKFKLLVATENARYQNEKTKL